ncbi:MAG: class E sortase [Frankiaceae bacterium]|nr:class E sortase [Frankiaceae bacterium]MBV9869954.1 class E sortase [Frankiaceae bacterium]
MLSVTAVWLLIYGVFLSGIQERSAQHRLYSQLRFSLAQEVAPLGGAIKPGTPLAVISMPAAGLNRAVVVEGTTSTVLRDGPGHQQNTPLPGQLGWSVLMGRSVSFGAPFKDIGSLHPGDIITATTQQGTFHYSVINVRHNGDPLPPPVPDGGGRLTLVSSQGSGWRAGWAPSHEVFVDAALKEKALLAPAGRPTVIAPSATAMHSDTSGLESLVLWLQALLIVGGATVWASSRWGLWQAWLAGAPVILALVWVVSSNVFRLLPNLM